MQSANGRSIVTMVGKGRKKVEIELIKEPSSRMVCFSKRRKGLFKKAKELSVLTGSKTAVLAFSQAGKLFCSDAQAFDSLLSSHDDVPSEKDEREFDFADVRPADTLFFPEAHIPSEKESEGLRESAFADARINADSFCRQFDVSSGTEGGEDLLGEREYAYTEAMAVDSIFDPSFDMDFSLVESMIDQLDSFTRCWQFDFNEVMAGKEQHFWYDRPNAQNMSSKELQQLESSIL